MPLYLHIKLLCLNVAELASCCRSSGEESLAMLAAAKIGISLEESSYDEKTVIVAPFRFCTLYLCPQD